DKPRHQEHLDTPEAEYVSGDVTPFGHSDTGPEHDDRGGEYDEGRGKAEDDLVDQPVQEAVGIKSAEPQVEWVATKASAPRGRTRARRVGLEQPEPPERFYEPFDHAQLGQRPEFLSGALAHHCDRRGAVELARDEMFGLAETEEAACRRILQDHGAIL